MNTISQDIQDTPTATLETKIQIFQYKFLNNILYLNKKLFHFGIISQSKCSFCKLLYDETPQHPFYTTLMHKIYGTNFNYIFQKKVELPILNPQGTIFSFTDVLGHNYLLIYHLLLIFKYIIYNSRFENTLSFQSLKCAISQIKYIEITISKNDLNKKKKKSK